MRMSLATKCELLFGAAAVIIISAALFVPWQRMEQLTEELNDAGAQAVVDVTLRHHILQPYDTNRVFSPTLPRLVSINPRPGERITPWERSILVAVRSQPDVRDHAQKVTRRDGTERFRFAAVVTLQRECTRCHTADVAADFRPIGSLSHATTLPAVNSLKRPGNTADPRNPIIGFVSVDIPAQTHTVQLLLNRVFLLTAGLFAGTLAVVVLYLILTRLILQPVRVLQEAAEKVSRDDLNIRSDINSGDEFEQLSRTFNTMMVNLKSSADQLRAINKNLDLKIGQLAESNVALYESNRLKSEFLANVSHELRTPLNSILGFTELLKDAGNGDGKSARYLQNIQSSGRSLLLLINDLLDLAKIEAGRMEVRSEPLSLNDLFEGLISILRPLTEPKSLTLRSSVAPDVPILQTDAHKLQQVLYNFLSNAIKFSPDGGDVEMTARLDEAGQVRIGVSDHGPGIEAEYQQAIFEKFRQIDGSVTRRHGGSGLGLAISKELTQLLGGSIHVRSAPGEGATFYIQLPLNIQAGFRDLRLASVG